MNKENFDLYYERIMIQAEKTFTKKYKLSDENYATYIFAVKIVDELKAIKALYEINLKMQCEEHLRVIFEHMIKIILISSNPSYAEKLVKNSRKLELTMTNAMLESSEVFNSSFEEMIENGENPEDLKKMLEDKKIEILEEMSGIKDHTIQKESIDVGLRPSYEIDYRFLSQQIHPSLLNGKRLLELHGTYIIKKRNNTYEFDDYLLFRTLQWSLKSLAQAEKTLTKSSRNHFEIILMEWFEDAKTEIERKKSNPTEKSTL